MWAIKCDAEFGIKVGVHRGDSGDTKDNMLSLYSGKKREPGIVLTGDYAEYSKICHNAGHIKCVLNHINYRLIK